MGVLPVRVPVSSWMNTLLVVTAGSVVGWLLVLSAHCIHCNLSLERVCYPVGYFWWLYKHSRPWTASPALGAEQGLLSHAAAGWAGLAPGLG